MRDLIGKRLGREAALKIVTEVYGRTRAVHMAAWIRLMGLTGERPMTHADLAALYGCSASGVGTWTRRIANMLGIAERRELKALFPNPYNDYELDALRRSNRPLSADLLTDKDWIKTLSESEGDEVIDAAEIRIRSHERTVVRPAIRVLRNEMDAMIDDAVAEALADREMIPLNKVIRLIRTRKYTT